MTEEELKKKCNLKDHPYVVIYIISTSNSTFYMIEYIKNCTFNMNKTIQNYKALTLLLKIRALFACTKRIIFAILIIE